MKLNDISAFKVSFIFKLDYEVLSSFNNFNFLNKSYKSAFTDNNCIIKRNVNVWANKISRNSPEMDIIRATVNNPDSGLGRLIKQIGISDTYLHREMEDLMKRGISINKIKDLFFEQKMDLSDYYEVEDIYIHPFQPYITPSGYLIKDKVKLIGRDYELYKDNKFNLEKNKFRFEDVLCQTLISSILEYDKLTKYHTKNTKVPTADLSEYIENYEKEHSEGLTPKERERLDVLKGLFIDSFVSAENNLPMFFQSWNREYMKGLKEMRQKGASYDDIDKYNRRYMDKILDFNEKLIKNLRIYQQVTNDFKFTKLFTNTIDFYGNNKADKWTEYLSNDLLDFLHKHAAFESQSGVNKIYDTDVDFEYLDIYLKLSDTNYFSKQRYKEEDKLMKEYIDFNLNRRKICKLMSPRRVPYWIWYEFWRNRDQSLYENYYKMLKEIVISNPFEDLGEVTKGTVQSFYSSFIPEKIKKSHISRMLDGIIDSLNKVDNENISNIIGLINKYSHSKIKNIADDYTGFVNDAVKDDEIDMNVIMDKIVEMDRHNFREGQSKQSINVVETANRGYTVEERAKKIPERQEEEEYKHNEHERIRELIDEQGEELEVKSIAYDFKDILSFDKFEEAYKRFNLKHFGTEDYSLYKGQLVKGKVYRVSRTKVTLDIHAYAMATLTLDRYYNTPSEVPLNGFLNVFKEGDELMVEVDEIWDDEIMVSLKKIRNYHKYKNILYHKKKNEIFYVKVLQRYTKGVLVQYVEGPLDGNGDGDDNSGPITITDDHKGNTENSNESEEKNEVDLADKGSFDEYIRETMKKKEDLREIGFIPLRQLGKKYKDKMRVVDINLVGKIIPVMYESYEFQNQIPILSTKKALRRMQIMNLRKGDIVKGYVKEYKPYYVVVRIGALEGVLHVRDMNEENYKQHLIDYPKSILAEVKYVNPANETIILSTMDLFEAGDKKLLNSNSFLKKFKSEPASTHIDRYNSFVNRKKAPGDTDEANKATLTGRGGPGSDAVPESEGMANELNSKGIKAYKEDDSTSDEYDYEFEEDDEKYLEKVNPVEQNMVEWKLVGDKLIDDPSLMHGYNLHTWYIHLNQWTPFPAEIQDKLNYQFNNNNQVAYFDYLGDSYKVIFDEDVALSVKRGTEYIFNIKKVKLIGS